MENNKIFSQILSLPEEWEVYEVKFQEKEKTVQVKIRYLKEEGVCRETGKICPVYDYRPEREWRYLDMMGYKTYLYCRVPAHRSAALRHIGVPRVKNSLGKVSSIAVPWSDDRGLSRRKLLDDRIISINIDEKSYEKGQHYITVISEKERSWVIEIGKDRTKEATEVLLRKTLTETQLASLRAVCVDMWDSFIGAIKKTVRMLRSYMINFMWYPISIKE